jgi:hypothetical protein
MNRLCDEDGSDPISERGIAILRGTPATTSPPELKRRVWASLQRTSVTSAVGLRPLGVKAVALGLATIAIAATAGAAIGGRWITSLGERPSTASARAPRPQHWRGTAARRIASAAEATEIAQPLPSVAPAEPPLTIPEQVAGRAVAPMPSHKLVASAQAAGRTEVLDALIALRRDHDAEGASRLLDRYLAANRRGALREEALVLAIEAADARHDQVHARVFARAYQVEFPAGRFVAFAHHHLTSTVGGAAPEAAPTPSM